MRLILSAGVMAATVGIAEAAPKCPSGQIYRVTQKTCVNKEAALRDGIISKRTQARPARVTKIQRAPKQVTRQTRQIRQARLDRAQLADDVRGGAFNQPKVQQPVTPSVAINSAGATTSPFGALINPWTPTSLSSPAQDLFSLKTAD